MKALYFTNYSHVDTAIVCSAELIFCLGSEVLELSFMEHTSSIISLYKHYNKLKAQTSKQIK